MRGLGQILLVYSCLLLLVRNPVCHGEQYEEFLQRQLPQLCPYSTFCTVGPSKNFTSTDNISPCCLPCSCEPDCLSRGNCCPDFPMSKDRAAITERCSVPSHQIGENYDSRMFGASFGLPLYYIIDTCPVQHDDEEEAHKCSQHDLDNPSELVAVSDTEGHVYQNAHCARCHGIKDYTIWKHRVLCPYIVSQKMVMYSLKTLVQLGCSMFSTPPTPSTAVSSRCYAEHYNSCNETGAWETFDSNVMKACESTTFYYFEENRFGRRVNIIYKNPFCYLCNVPQSKRDGKPTQCIDGNVDVGKTTDQWHFTALLNMELYNTDITADGQICQKFEVYDSYFGKCRTLECQFGCLPAWGKCMRAMLQAKGMAVHILFHIASVNLQNAVHKNLAQPLLHDALVNISISLLQRLHANARSCLLYCSAHLQTSENKLFLHIQYEINIRCTIERIIAIFNKWRMQNVTFASIVDKQNASFTANWMSNVDEMEAQLKKSGKPKEYVDYGRIRNTIKGDGSCSFELLMSSSHFYCPNVDVTKDEFIHLSQTNTNQGKLGDFTEMKLNASHNTSVYRICWDNYKLFMVVNGAQARGFTTQFGMILMSWVCAYLAI